MRIVVAPESDELRRQVAALHEQAWGDASGHDPALAPVSMLLVDGDEVVAALDILTRVVRHRGETYKASGLSTVVTHERHRHQGHGLELVRAARAQIDADLVIFTCDEPLARFYERAGFERLEGTQLIGGTTDDPLPSGPLGKVTLAAFLSEHAQEHRADFEGADIELHPGAIDRLW